MPGANAIAAPLLDAGAEDPFLLKVRGLWLHNAGQFREALRVLHHARTLTPEDPSILIFIAGCLGGLGEFDAALKMADAALELAPRAAAMHYMRAWILENTRDYAAARDAYERTLSLSPKHVQALAGLASSCVRLGDFATARAKANEALALAPGQPTAAIALSLADIGLGTPEPAAKRMRGLLQHRAQLPPRARALALGVLGDALDAEDRCADAFAAYRDKAEEFRGQYATAMAGRPKLPQQLAALTDHLAALPANAWRGTTPPAPAEDEPRTHVFLLGFLRSGTTLLEQVLVASPDVVSLEERNTLQPLADAYLAAPEGLDRLAALDEGAAMGARAAYWKRVREYGVEPAGKVFIDKEPLNTLNLPLIGKLFPVPRSCSPCATRATWCSAAIAAISRSIRRSSNSSALRTVRGSMPRSCGWARPAEARWRCRCTNIATRTWWRISRPVSARPAISSGLPGRTACAISRRQRRARPIHSPSAAQVRQPLYSEGAGRMAPLCRTARTHPADPGALGRTVRLRQELINRRRRRRRAVRG